MRTLFEDSINRYLKDKLTPELIASTEQGQWLEPLWTGLEELGFCNATAPENRGGIGAQWGDIFPVIHACGYHNLPLPLPETLLANWFLGLAGLEGSSSPISIAENSELTLNDGLVTGQLIDVPWGRSVTKVLAQTQTGTFALLEPTAAHNIETSLNVGREPRDTLFFEQVRPLATFDLPENITANALPSKVLQLGGAMLRTAQIAGALERCLDLSATYTNDRVQFGKPLSKFQAVQQQMAVLAEEVAAMRIAAEVAFANATANSLPELAIATAKIRAGEAIDAGASIAHAVHGAIGFTYEHSLHFSTRRLWSWESEFGSTTFWSSRIGTILCQRGSKYLWSALTQGTL